MYEGMLRRRGVVYSEEHGNAIELHIGNIERDAEVVATLCKEH